MYLDYVSYRVRAFERGPLRCYWCQEYGHVAEVCRRGRNRCRRCGKEGCSEEDCKLTVEQAVCLHCEGNHEAGAKQCERRIKCKPRNLNQKRTQTSPKAVGTLCSSDLAGR